MPYRFCLSLILMLAAPAPGAEWPQFRGPGGQGHADATGLPVSWGEGKNVAWKTAIPGRGWSSPVVLGNQVWLTTAVDDGKSLRAVCVDVKTGTIRYDVEVFAPSDPVHINARNTHASPTPVVEPGRVYVHFGAMGTACLSTETAEILWRNDTLKIDHQEGPGSSPVPFEDLLIVNCDGRDEQYVAALHRETGEVAWKTKRSAPLKLFGDFRKAFSTPLVIDVAGRPQLVSPGADQINAYDPRTGKELWQVRYNGFSTVPRPVFDGKAVYLSTGYMKPQLWAIRPDGEGNVTDSHVLWKLARQAPANPSPVLAAGRLYMVSDAGVLTCVDTETGEPLWQERLSGKYWASPLYADGRLYLSGESGTVTVIKPGDKYELLAENQLDGELLASPAVADGALFFRTETHLYRIEEAK